MPNLDLDELDRLWGGKRIRDIVRRVGNAESGLDAALDVIDILLDLARGQQEQLAKRNVAVGVGESGSNLYVRGSDEATKLVQESLLERDALRQVLRDMARQVPPKLWQYRDAWGDYLGWGKPKDSDYVARVDMSNSGDVHEHGWAVGEWALLWELVEKAGLEEWLKEVPNAD